MGSTDMTNRCSRCAFFLSMSLAKSYHFITMIFFSQSTDVQTRSRHKTPTPMYVKLLETWNYQLTLLGGSLGRARLACEIEFALRFTATRVREGSDRGSET